ncbi:MAG: RNase J family beta-CASP ribonuclease [Nanoarchaeota archaeon]|nr:RNase J family beta-CASP ribonuclease [Nanoarchaeota archaeon]
MSLIIHAIGGYNEIGKNMTLIEIDDEAVVLDMGIHLEKYIAYTEDEDLERLSASELIKAGAIPDINQIGDLRKKVKAIIPTHAHLDHVGALVFLANKFDAPIICTQFTKSVLNEMTKDEKVKIKNPIKVLNAGSTVKISDDISVEFVNTTHSTPQTVMAVIHTKYGPIIYANDFKFDSYPVFGKKPDFKRLKELGQMGIKALIVDCLRVETEGKTPSENVAKDMLRDVMLGTESEGKAMIATTFSSHLSRLKSITEFGHQLNREVIFLGRSLAKYTNAGKDAKIANFSEEVKIVKYAKQVKRVLKRVERDRGKYLLVVTGHQGEPKSVLSRIVNRELEFNFHSGDHIIFASSVIPNLINKSNSDVLEKKLKSMGVRIFRDIHVSGHAGKEDLRDLILMTTPQHLIPAHGEHKMVSAFSELAHEMGYQHTKNLHLLRDGQKLNL